MSSLELPPLEAFDPEELTATSKLLVELRAGVREVEGDDLRELTDAIEVDLFLLEFYAYMRAMGRNPSSAALQDYMNHTPPADEEDADLDELLRELEDEEDAAAGDRAAAAEQFESYYVKTHEALSTLAAVSQNAADQSATIIRKIT